MKPVTEITIMRHVNGTPKTSRQAIENAMAQIKLDPSADPVTVIAKHLEGFARNKLTPAMCYAGDNPNLVTALVKAVEAFKVAA